MHPSLSVLVGVLFGVLGVFLFSVFGVFVGVLSVHTCQQVQTRLRISDLWMTFHRVSAYRHFDDWVCAQRNSAEKPGASRRSYIKVKRHASVEFHVQESRKIKDPVRTKSPPKTIFSADVSYLKVYI